MNKLLASRVQNIIRLHSRDLKIKAFNKLAVSRELKGYLIRTYCGIPTKEDGKRWNILNWNEYCFVR